MKFSEMYFEFRTNLEYNKLVLCEAIAIALYYLHIPFSTKSYDGEAIVIGYGKFKHSRFPFYLPIKFYPHLNITFFWQYKSIYKSFIHVDIIYTTPYVREEIQGKSVETIQYAEELFEFPKIVKKEYAGSVK